MFKATGTEPIRAPSIGLTWTSRSSGKAADVVHAREPCLAPFSPATSWVDLVKDRLLASSYPTLRGSSRVAPRLAAHAKKARLSDFCNQLPIRAPCSLSDPTSIAAAGWSSLDGDSRASTSLQPSSDARSGRPRSKALSRFASRWTALSAIDRACSPASDTLSTTVLPAFRRITRPLGTLPPPPRQR